MPKNLFILYESALGLALFKVNEADEISKPGLRSSIRKLSTFQTMVHLEAFQAFNNQKEALETVSQIADSVLTENVAAFLRQSLPELMKKKKSSKKDESSKLNKKVVIGVSEPLLGSAIKNDLKVECRCDDLIFELIRGIRQHFDAIVSKHLSVDKGDCETARIGLGHGYSRSRVKFNVNRADNMIIQAIAMLDQLDKDVNTYAMRCREWYSWHFPEMGKLVSDQILFARIVEIMGNKKNFTLVSNFIKNGKMDDDDDGDNNASPLSGGDLYRRLEEALDTLNEAPELIEQICELQKTSMGIDVSAIDIAQIRSFARRVVSLSQFRQSVHSYLCSRMESCAPNLTALIGEQVGARLISKAGSLIKLAKFPASTVQILGAEKALFRALKSRGKCNTPKYGLIFNSTFISRANAKDKGRISRYLANKAAMATRLDCFLDEPTSLYGRKFREQVEERLAFFQNGTVPTTNQEAMKFVRDQLDSEDEDKDAEMDYNEKEEESKSKKNDDDSDVEMQSRGKRKRKQMEESDESEDSEDDSEAERKRLKKQRKKEKKEKKEKKKRKKEKKKKSKSGIEKSVEQMSISD